MIVYLSSSNPRITSALKDDQGSRFVPGRDDGGHDDDDDGGGGACSGGGGGGCLLWQRC